MNSFFFSHFLLAHFLVDYPFQTDKLFETKTKKFYGVIIHSLILFFFLILLSIPYSTNFFVFISSISLALLHLFQDQIKIYLTKKEEGENFYYFLIDQILHIFFIFLFSLLPLPDVIYKDRGFLKFYFDPFYSYLIVSLIFVTYFIWIFLHSINNTFFKKEPLVKGFWKYYGYLERIFAFFVSFLYPYIFFISYIFLLPRFFKKKKIIEGFLGISLSLLLGILLRWIR
ncbi:MAG: DUF3307 domain-containing protein [candidate division WOR-3 bacterium]